MKPGTLLKKTTGFKEGFSVGPKNNKKLAKHSTVRGSAKDQ